MTPHGKSLIVVCLIATCEIKQFSPYAALLFRRDRGYVRWDIKAAGCPILSQLLRPRNMGQDQFSEMTFLQKM